MARTFMVQVGDQYVVSVQRGTLSQEYVCATRELAQRWLKLFELPVRPLRVQPAA